MKNEILIIALQFMSTNGKVSNLEIKNRLYENTPGNQTCSITQSEVSAIMHDLYVEQNWSRELNKSVPGVAFYEYSLQLPVVGPGLTPATSGVTTVSTPASQPVNVTKKLNQLDPANGVRVCYVSGHPEKYAQGNGSKRVLRNLCFHKYNDSTIGLTYDNINFCTVDFFNKHKVA